MRFHTFHTTKVNEITKKFHEEMTWDTDDEGYYEVKFDGFVKATMSYQIEDTYESPGEDDFEIVDFGVVVTFNRPASEEVTKDIQEEADKWLDEKIKNTNFDFSLDYSK